MKRNDFISFMYSVIHELEAGNYHGTAHVYKSSLKNFLKFCQKEHFAFSRMTPDLLKGFEDYMRKRQLSWNTISTYLRAIRATYNRAVDKYLAPYVPRLFKHVYTGTRADKKRALDVKDMSYVFQTLKAQNTPEVLRRSQGLFVLMFMLRGLPFVDLVYLQKKDLDGNVLTYRRRKTGRLLTVIIPQEAMRLMEENMDRNSSSPYLFSFLKGEETSAKAYQVYQLALRNFNHQLSLISDMPQLGCNLSSYTARHTWATLAYYCNIHPGVISEAMGHSSITVTETYLKPFSQKRIREANDKIISSIQGNC